MTARTDVEVDAASEADRAVTAALTVLREGGSPDPDAGFAAVHVDDEATEALDALRIRTAVAAAALEGAPAATVLGWAAAVVPRFAITSSFGAESAVLLHLLSRTAPQVPVLFLETGLHFDETLAFRDGLAADLGLTVVDVTPERTVAQQAADEGDALWLRDPDRCCALRKTAPLQRAMRPYDGWASGVRRVQTPERAATPVVDTRRQGERWLVKVSPLATWTDADVDAYLATHDLPRHPLVAEGYRSIGCGPCTARTAPGEDPRAGRWAAFDGKTECGIHLPQEAS